MAAGSRVRHATRFCCLFLVLVSAVLVSGAGSAAAWEQAFIPNGQGKLTTFDAMDYVPLGDVQIPGTALWGMAANPAAGKLYTFDTGTQTVSVIDAALARVVDSISLQDLRVAPYGMAVSADGKRLYLTAQGRELGLIAVDLERRLLIGEFAVPNAWRVLPHPTLDRLWVTTRDGNLYTVRASDMKILGGEHVGWSEIGLSSDGSRLYIAGGSLREYDIATGTLGNDIPLTVTANHLRVAGRWAYVGDNNRGVLGIVDLVDRHFEKVVTLDVPAPGKYAHVAQIDVNADGSRVAVLLDNDLHYKFAVVDGVNHTLLSLSGRMGGNTLICASTFIVGVQYPETTFAVNSTADAPDANPGDGVCETGAGSGVCTLRAAVQEGNATFGSVVVTLPAGEYVLAIPGMDEDEAATGDLDVRGRLAIRGAGSEATIVDGGAIDRVLDVAAAGSLRLEGVTVRNGRLPFRDPNSFRNDGGGGVRNLGVLTLSGVAITGNSTEGFGGGGVHSEAVLRAENCTFSGNSSQGMIIRTDPLGGNPVLVASKGVAAVYAAQGEIKDSRFTGNTSAVAVRVGGALAGCVVSDNDAAGVVATSVSRSTISGNRGPGCSAALVTDSTVSGNVNTEPDGCGGGIAWFAPYDPLVVARSTVSGNAATRGGGICAQYFELENSTVSGNAATGDGGGIYVQEYDVWNYVRNSTITANTAGIDGGGIFNAHPDTHFDTHLSNTILAGNMDGGGQAPDCAGYLGSSQFNLVGDATGCGFDALEWDIVGRADAAVDPLLGPLADNGGPTATHALLAGSPAIDAANQYIFAATDQRGVSRPQDGTYDGTAYSDIGAFELTPLLWTINASAGPGGAIEPAGAVVLADGGSKGFAITPAPHYLVADVLVDGVPVGPVRAWSFDGVTADHTIAASFALDTHTISASAGANGSITPAGSVVVPHGGVQSYAMTPAPHHHVARVLVDGVSAGPVRAWSFEGVTVDHSIAASFAIDTYTISASAGVNGTIWPRGKISVAYGGSQTFRVRAKAGYAVAKLIVDGRNLGPRTQFTVRRCSADHVIQARFRRIW